MRERDSNFSQISQRERKGKIVREREERGNRRKRLEIFPPIALLYEVLEITPDTRYLERKKRIAYSLLPNIGRRQICGLMSAFHALLGVPAG
jgi:hypothetical protein